MKSIAKLSLLAVVSTILSSGAYADDPQLQNRIAMQRQEADRARESATIGVYAYARPIGESTSAFPAEVGLTDTGGRQLIPLHLGRGEVIYVPILR